MLRVFAIVLSVLGCTGANPRPQPTVAGELRVTLLGTSSPRPDASRFGPSTLVEAGRQKLLIDAGRGVPIRLAQLGIPLGAVDRLFITHFHSDHVAGIPDLWLTGWLATAYGGRNAPFAVTGPPGIKAMMDNLERAYAIDVATRLADEQLPPDGVRVSVDEFDHDGTVFEHDGLKVIAFAVEHGELIKPSVGYRIEYAGHAVVVSGDTRYDENVARHAMGADLVVHEVACASPEAARDPKRAKILGHHTSPEDAGRIFAAAKPRLAVFTHVILMACTVDELVTRTRTTYAGPLQTGEDLMSFEIGATVAVNRWPNTP